MRHLRLVVPALVLTLGLGACGDDGEEAAADGGGGGGGTRVDGGEQAELDFYDCLRDQGVDVEDPDPGQQGIQIDSDELGLDTPEGEAAMEACQDELPGQMSEAPDAEGLEHLREFTACMRENGVDMEDPGSDGMLSMPEGVDPNSNELQTAMGECQSLLAGTPIRIGGPG